MEEKLPILTLPDSRKVWLDGNQISSQDALHIAQQLFDAFGLHGPRITRHLMYEVDPAIWSDCPHTTSIEDAIETSKEEEELAKKHGEKRR